MFSIKKGLCESRPSSSLVESLGKAFNEIASTFGVVILVVTDDSVTRRPKTQRSLRCLLVECLMPHASLLDVQHKRGYSVKIGR